MQNIESDILPNSIAPLWRRIAAMLYDFMLLIAIWMLVAYLIMTGFKNFGSVTEENGFIILNSFQNSLLFLAIMLVTALFFSWFWRRSGQTIGMQAWKVKVQNIDGSAISHKQCLIRLVLAPLSLAFMGIGYFWQLKDKQQRSLHDIASNSIIVKVTR